ncbi:MAG: site-specific integrase, partial [Planctomycetes bacterium]|nr:site-specific integrase [Planctomycetota bacterium]
FIGADGERKTVRLGAVSQRTAEAVKVRVERLVSASITGHAVDDATALWLANLAEPFLAKLAKVGLIPRRAAARSLQQFLDAYITARSDTKPNTRIVYGHTRRCLIEFFRADRALGDITPGDADDWRLWLKTEQKLSDNTVRRRCGIAKQFFKAAMRKGLIATNPFTDLVSTVQGNAKRLYYVSREDALRVLDACPDSQWRLIFALSRYGGLRCPSEHIALRWEDVDWARNRLTIRSPKTEHHPNGASRQIPLFPELLPHLRQAFEEAEPGTEFIITRYRATNQNLRTQLTKIIKRAGLEPWPKLFHNLRSTRETELAETFPLHVVCAWIGNSQLIAAKHYLQITDDHFAQAAEAPAQGAEIPTSALGGRPAQPEQALQNALQHPAARARTASHAGIGRSAKSASCKEIRNVATECENAGIEALGDTGLEPESVTSASSRLSFRVCHCS